jgi:hypothetical protein
MCCTLLQIEREKADLSVQVIQLVERLEEAEGGAESQVSVTHLTSRQLKKEKNLNSVASVRKRTIPTERPPLVGEVSVNLCG